MLRFVVRRLLLLVPILLGVSLLVFVWIRALPGGPATALLGERATPEAVAALEHQYGLDKPIYVQYSKYVKQLATLQLGTSSTSRQEVTTEIRQRFPATVELTIAAGLFAVIFGIPLGFIAAKHYQGPVDHASLVVSLIGISTPIFFLALILKYVFSVRLGWLPSVGRMSVLIDIPHPTNFYLLDAILARNWDAFVDVSKHLILPAIALGSIPMAIIARITRASVLDVNNEDYVRTARAKGLKEKRVDSRHIMRNAWLPVVTVIGLSVGGLLAGAVLTETVFSWPGVGRYVVDAIGNRDYFIIQSSIMFFAVIFLIVNLLVDLSYAYLNPRIRYS